MSSVHQTSFLPEASFGLRILCLPASVCECIFVCQPQVCLRHNSSRLQVRTTKFGQKMQINLVKTPIVFFFFLFFVGGCVFFLPWPSRSNLICKPNVQTPFGVCPHHNLPPILVRTTKFEQKMQNRLLRTTKFGKMQINLVKVRIVLGFDWPWPSRSN